MASINDISIIINSLFQDIINPITLGLNRINFFKTYKNIAFKYAPTNDFEFQANPILKFDNSELLMNFLKKEKLLAVRFQDNSYDSEIQKLIAENSKSNSLDNFYLDYTIEINDHEILVYFNTNSLIFRYEMIG